MKKLLKLVSLCSMAMVLVLTVVITSASAYVIGPTSPGKWGPPAFGTGATVTWSLMPTGTLDGTHSTANITALGGFMPAGYLAEIQSAFDAWSDVADLTFTQIVDGGEPFNTVGPSGDIRLGGHVFDGAYGVLAHGYYPPNNGLTAAGDIHFDIAEPWKIGFGGPGFDIFTVAAHEIGHAIGLGHVTGVQALMNPVYTQAFHGLLADDIDGAQAIYGVAAVPEPSTMILLVSGLAGLIVLRKKKA